MNVSEMSAKEMQELQDALNIRKEQMEEERLEKLRSKMGVTEESMKEEFDSLTKEVEELSNSFKVTLDIPVVFEIHMSGSIGEAVCEEGDASVGSVFDKSISAKLGKSTLNKKQQRILTEVVEDYVANSCEEIYELFTDSFAEHQDLVKRIKSFIKLFRKAEFNDDILFDDEG